MTAALEGGEWSAARPGRTLPLGKTRYPLYRRLGGTQARSGRAENLVPTGIRSRTVQPVVSCYVDWATGPNNTTRGFWFCPQILSETFLILTRTAKDIINVNGSLCKVPVILVRLQWKLNFPEKFSKIIQVSNLIKKYIPVVPCGRTDRHNEAIGRLFAILWTRLTSTRDEHPCPRRDSNPRSQPTSGSRPTP